MAYSKTTWKDNEAPYLNATNLNKIETGIDNNDQNITDSEKDIVANAQNIASNTANIANNRTDIDINADNISGLSTGEFYQGEWTPVLGTEYPTGAEQGYSYYIIGLSDSGYEFTTGDLTGRIANNNDKMMYSGTEWTMVDNTSCKDYFFIVDDVASMLATTPVNGSRCETQGYYTKNDGGGGSFNYDPSQSGTNDGGMVMYGWVRQTNEINVLMFGATPDDIDTSTAFEKAALYAAQFELGDSKMPAINITKGTYRVTRAMPIATWVLGTGVVITGNGSVDPSFAEDTTYLTGSVIDFNGVNQGNTLRVGDPAFVHQKAIGKAVGGEVIGASDTGSGGLGGISHASGASGVQQGCIGVTASVVNDQDGWDHPTWGLYAEVTQTTGHGALWGAEFTTRKPEGSVTQVKSPYNNQNPTIDGSAYCATFTAGGGEYIPDGDNFNYYPQNITAFIGMSAKGDAQADKGIIIDDGSIATSQAIVMPNEYSIMHYTSDTETINTLRNGNKSKIIVRSDDLNAAALLEHHKKPTSGETNVDDKLSVIRAFGEYVGSEVALSTRRVTQTTAFNSGTGTASSELVEEVSSSTSTSKRGTRLHYNDLAPTVTNVMSLGNATYTWNKVFAVTYNAGGLNGATGSFTSQDGKTITVTGGIITSII